MTGSTLSPTQRYAAGALLALALRQAQIHQTRPLGSDVADPDSPAAQSERSSTSSIDDDGDDQSHLWTHESQGLLRPVFSFLEIDEKAWSGLEETAAVSEAKHHIGAYLRMIFEEEEENSEKSSERSDQELALSKGVDAMAMTLDQNQQSDSTDPDAELNLDQLTLLDSPIKYQRKIVLLYELLSACVSDSPIQNDKKLSKFRKGYDSRHRAGLRLLATWLNIKWNKMEAMEIMVACTAMAVAKEEEKLKEEESPKSNWEKWKRGGIIGAAALTGGTLLAITGGLAAPAIAAGFGALAPTLGTLVPVIGASGFAAMATAAGSVAGSVAVAASFGAAGAGLSGTKMARRIGSIKEFEFKPIGENHNQGRLAVGILVAGFVFEEDDFVRPWDGWNDNLERYALQWESKNLIAVSTAIQDWITSRVTMELMKQGAMMTVLSSLVTAFAWPAVLLSATDFIDSKWSIAIDRSDKAGKLLAEVLLKGLQGNRPVTLVGFSLGARVIFKCLQELAESGNNDGLVERVVLLGAPVSVKGEQWDSARKTGATNKNEPPIISLTASLVFGPAQNYINHMVAGRFINVYSTNDWILGITFRASLLTQGLAGIQAVDIPGIENVDVTEMIEGHSSYLTTARDILQRLELETYYPVFLPPPVVLSDSK